MTTKVIILEKNNDTHVNCIDHKRNWKEVVDAINQATGDHFVVIAHCDYVECNELDSAARNRVRVLYSRFDHVNWRRTHDYCGIHLDGRTSLGSGDIWSCLVDKFRGKSWDDALKAFEGLTTPKIKFNDVATYLQAMLDYMKSSEGSENRKQAVGNLDKLRPALGMDWVETSQ